MNYKVTFRNSLLSATMTICVEARSVEEAAEVVRRRYNLWHKDIISVELKNRNYGTIQFGRIPQESNQTDCHEGRQECKDCLHG